MVQPTMAHANKMCGHLLLAVVGIIVPALLVTVEMIITVTVGEFGSIVVVARACAGVPIAVAQY